MTARNVAIALTTEQVVSTIAENDSVKVSVDKALAVRPTLEVTTTQDVIITPTLEALVVTSKMRQLLY